MAVDNAVRACSICFVLRYSSAQAEVAVGLERAHAEFLGQGEGLAVVGCSGFDLWRLVVRRNLAEEPQGVGFVAPFLMGSGELQGVLRLGVRLVQPAGQQIRLAQPDHPERMVEHETHRHGLLDRLLQQRQGLGGPSGERIGRPQGAATQGTASRMCAHLREVEGPFEHGDGLGKLPLAQQPKANGPIRQDTAVGVIGGLGDPHPFLCRRPPFGEGAALGKVAGEEAAGKHGGQPRQAEALME